MISTLGHMQTVSASFLILFLVIDLLKTLIVAAEKRGSETESYDYVLAYDRRDLVPERQKKLFGEDDINSERHDSGIDELTSKQLDINLSV